MKSRTLILGLASLAMPAFSAYAQSAYSITPQQELYTAREDGSFVLVSYNFTNLSDFPIWLWSTPADSPQVFDVVGDHTDQAIFLTEVSPIIFPIKSLKADPGQTLVSFVQYLFITPAEADGDDWGLTTYAVFPELWATTTDDVLGPFAPGGTADGFAIKVLDVPEPVSWALMVAGFGLAGFAMRSRRNIAVSFI
jgi:hypothetical protein